MFFYDEGRILSAEMVQTIEFADTYGQDTYEESMLNLYFKDKEGNVTDQSKLRLRTFGFDDFEEGSWEGVGFGDDQDSDKDMEQSYADELMGLFGFESSCYLRNSVFFGWFLWMMF